MPSKKRTCIFHRSTPYIDSPQLICDMHFFFVLHALGKVFITCLLEKMDAFSLMCEAQRAMEDCGPCAQYKFYLPPQYLVSILSEFQVILHSSQFSPCDWSIRHHVSLEEWCGGQDPTRRAHSLNQKSLGSQIEAFVEWHIGRQVGGSMDRTRVDWQGARQNLLRVSLVALQTILELARIWMEGYMW